MEAKEMAKEKLAFEEWLSKLVQELGKNNIKQDLALETLSFNERKAPADPTAVAFATLNSPAYHEWTARLIYKGTWTQLDDRRQRWGEYVVRVQNIRARKFLPKLSIPRDPVYWNSVYCARAM